MRGKGWVRKKGKERKKSKISYFLIYLDLSVLKRVSRKRWIGDERVRGKRGDLEDR